jgi:ribonucleoside-triphosphate reductase
MSGMWLGSENLKPEDSVADVIKHGTLGIGFIGLAECLIALTGKHHGESEEAQELGIEIITEMRDLTIEFAEKYDLNFSVLATPAEGLSGRFTKMDKKTYGIIPGVNDKKYYTNSNHVPVWYKCTAEHKAKIEAPYHELCRGGHIFYIELDGNAVHNPGTIKAVVDLMDKYNMGYGSINHTRSRCIECGFENADANLVKCPKCGSTNIDTIQRITGYLVGTTSRWNNAKLDELKDRIQHTGFEENK